MILKYNDEKQDLLTSLNNFVELIENLNNSHEAIFGSTSRASLERNILDFFEKLVRAELGHGWGFNCRIDFQIKWIKEGDPVKNVRTKNRSIR